LGWINLTSVKKYEEEEVRLGETIAEEAAWD
jgi:hypothetical protein